MSFSNSQENWNVVHFIYVNNTAIGKDHEKLANFLNKTLDLNWLLTYDDVSSIENLYPERRKRKFPIQYSARVTRKGQELMIFSDSLSV